MYYLLQSSQQLSEVDEDTEVQRGQPAQSLTVGYSILDSWILELSILTITLFTLPKQLHD